MLFCYLKIEWFDFLKVLKEGTGSSGWLTGKYSVCQAGDCGLIPGSGRFPRGGNGNPLQCSCLEKEFPGTEEPGELQSKGSQRGNTTEAPKEYLSDFISATTLGAVLSIHRAVNTHLLFN